MDNCIHGIDIRNPCQICALTEMCDELETRLERALMRVEEEQIKTQAVVEPYFILLSSVKLCTEADGPVNIERRAEDRRFLQHVLRKLPAPRATTAQQAAFIRRMAALVESHNAEEMERDAMHLTGQDSAERKT